jgi:hypothetical protein
MVCITRTPLRISFFGGGPLKYIVPLLALLGACDPGSVQKRVRPEPADTVISALAPGAARDDPAESTDADRRLVLEQGNYWTAGIPGFGENALRAFTGEYRIPRGGSPVQIGLTRELLYYEGWTSRSSMDGVRQKTEPEGTVAVTALDNIWTAIVLLPADCTAEEEDRILGAFRSGLTGIAGSPQNVSLPALIPF